MDFMTYDLYMMMMMNDKMYMNGMHRNQSMEARHRDCNCPKLSICIYGLSDGQRICEPKVIGENFIDAMKIPQKSFKPTFHEKHKLSVNNEPNF
jgi:hypothetical protein